MKNNLDTHIKIQNEIALGREVTINSLEYFISKKDFILFRGVFPFLKNDLNAMNVFNKRIYFSNIFKEDVTLKKLISPKIFKSNCLFFIVTHSKKENFFEKNFLPNIDTEIFNYLSENLSIKANLTYSPNKCRFYIDGNRISTGTYYHLPDGQISYLIGFPLGKTNLNKNEVTIDKYISKNTTELGEEILKKIKNLLNKEGLF